MLDLDKLKRYEEVGEKSIRIMRDLERAFFMQMIDAPTCNLCIDFKETIKEIYGTLEELALIYNNDNELENAPF